MRLSIYKTTLFLTATIIASVLSACSDDPDNPNNGNDDQIQGYDDLEWFKSSFIYNNYEDPDNKFKNGGILDEADPHTLSIVVESYEEARDYFINAIPSDSAERIQKLTDGTIIFKPTAESGEVQGEIRFERLEESGKYALVNFSGKAEMDGIVRIEFIDVSLWPENDAYISEYSVGDTVVVDTDKPYRQYGYGNKLEGQQKAICIREATSSSAGMLLYLSKNEYSRDNFKHLADYHEAQLALTLLKTDFDFYQELFRTIDRTLTKESRFWINMPTRYIPDILSHRRIPERRFTIKIEPMDIHLEGSYSSYPYLMVYYFR